MLRKGRDLFHKQHSDENDISGSHSKTKLAKIVVECRKEGIVNYSTPESLDQPGGPPKWERCRLALVKAVGGYMLEFYSPPKSTKVKYPSLTVNDSVLTVWYVYSLVAGCSVR